MPSAHNTRERRIAPGECVPESLEVDIYGTKLSQTTGQGHRRGRLVVPELGGLRLVRLVRMPSVGLRQSIVDVLPDTESRRDRFNQTPHLGVRTLQRECVFHVLEPKVHPLTGITSRRHVVKVR